jgi:hypothetical protein
LAAFAIVTAESSLAIAARNTCSGVIGARPSSGTTHSISAR